MSNPNVPHGPRVVHLYDHTCHGTLVRNNDNETLVGVIWDERPHYLHPCLREEVVFPSTRKRREERSERRPRRDYDDDDIR